VGSLRFSAVVTKKHNDAAQQAVNQA